MSPIRVLLADDHAVLRAGLRLLLDAQSDIRVVGESPDGADAVRRVPALKPDVVVMDLSMPGPPSGKVIRSILRAAPKTRVLILTMHDDEAYLRAALAAGASGFLVKRAADAELLTAIRAVYAGRTFVDLTAAAGGPPNARPATGAGQSSAPKELSKREREVLRLLAQGNSNREIAEAIHLSVKTVETYRTRLREKLGLHGRAELYRFAAESGILDTESPAPRRRR